MVVGRPLTQRVPEEKASSEAELVGASAAAAAAASGDGGG